MEKPFSPSQVHDLFAWQLPALDGGTKIGGHMWQICSSASAVPSIKPQISLHGRSYLHWREWVADDQGRSTFFKRCRTCFTVLRLVELRLEPDSAENCEHHRQNDQQETSLFVMNGYESTKLETERLYRLSRFKIGVKTLLYFSIRFWYGTTVRFMARRFVDMVRIMARQLVEMVRIMVRQFADMVR